ncbi:MAG: glycosyltransferase family 2 protein [Lachnospiraceae bacterium]|nr:glycosyltransferase family 2 protein [Lachnospiraceae bacterium]
MNDNGGDRLYIVIPAYNEEENIRQVIADWYPVVDNKSGDSRLVVVNDGSKDNTLKVLKDLQANHPKLVVLDKENGGHGSTILFGYRYALEQGADYVFQTDSDGQTFASEFGAFWDERNRYDMLIGFRSHREDGLSRIIVTKILKIVIRLCFHVSVTDANTPYRLMRASVLNEEIEMVPKDFFLSNVLITVLFTKHLRRIKYIPITFRPRQGGVNSINLKRIFRIGKQSLRDFRELNRRI